MLQHNGMSDQQWFPPRTVDTRMWCDMQNSHDRRNSGGTTPPDGACATCDTDRQLSKHAVHIRLEAEPCRVMRYL